MRTVAGGLLVAIGVLLPATLAARAMPSSYAPPVCRYHSAPITPT
jgi:hypothetical protein